MNTIASTVTPLSQGGLLLPLSHKVKVHEDSGHVSAMRCEGLLSGFDHSMCPANYPSAPNRRHTCIVCGDSTKGFHYGVPSCNGCKTFFRRTLIAGRKFVCRRGGNCRFDKNHRCACRACRFQRCVEVGMDPSAIQFVPSTVQAQRNKLRKLSENQQSNHSEEKCKAPIYPQLIGFEAEVAQCIGNALRLEEKHHLLRNSIFCPYDKVLSLAEMLKRSTSYGQAEKWPVVDNWPQRPRSNMCRLYKQVDRPPEIKFWFYTDLYLSIDYLKTFDVFQTLKEGEKIALVKSVGVANSLLSSAYPSYMRGAEIIVYPDGSYPRFHKGENVTEIEKKLRIGAVPCVTQLAPDRVEYSLLRTIACLNDACEGLSKEARLCFGEARSKYSRSLFHYLRVKHGTEKGATKFGESMMAIASLYLMPEVNHNYLVWRICVLNKSLPSRLYMDCMEGR